MRFASSYLLFPLLSAIVYSGSSRVRAVEQDFFPLPEDLIATDEEENATEATTTTTTPPPQTNENNNVDCPLVCMNGSICMEGDQSTEGHGMDPTTGGPLEFHEETNRNGWFCNCQQGWTGLQCELGFESCNDGQHVCYHGGKCIPGLEDEYGNEQLYCDCDDAIDPDQPTKRFTGKYCEEVIPNISECDERTETCKNGGVCNHVPEDSELEPCECQPGFRGKYCEYVEDSVPGCSKECLNGGVCRLGVDDDALDANSQESKYCECPVAFYGDQCESNAELCGEEYCYHGSKCFEILLADGSTEHLCDCKKAYTEDRHFAGEFCQYPSTQFCTGRDDPNGRQFCTNGGLCPEDSHKPCDCPPGYMGPRCAYQIGKDGGDYAECKLECQNGGTCQKGVKDLQAAYGKFASDVAFLLNETHENYEHCTCPDGFFGIRCEYEYEQCKESDHKCFHGSTCVNAGSDEQACDCESSDTQTAGLFCEFFATQDCSEYPTDFSDEHRGFCTNGGTCLIDDDG